MFEVMFVRLSNDNLFRNVSFKVEPNPTFFTKRKT
jgi:hypothetical protein